MERFVVRYAPIRDGQKVLDQWFVFDTRDSKFIVGYMDEQGAIKAADRANVLVTQSEL